MGLMGRIDGNNLQCALESFHYTCTSTRIQYYIQCVEHYTEYVFTTHNAKFISITYDWYGWTSTRQCSTSVRQLITYF